MYLSLLPFNSWSTKVVNFGTNRKCVRDLLLAINSDLGPILHRFGDTEHLTKKVENRQFLPTAVLLNALAQGDPFVFPR